MNLVSVIIPTYNRAHTLPRSIESVLNQSYSNFELIIVDDGSTDETADVIKQYNDSRIRYFHTENRGACAARNFGIKKARGEYISFQDSDDFWYPEKLQAELHCLAKNDADIVFCKMQSIDETSGRFLSVVPSKKQRNTFENLLISNFISTQMILMKTSIAKENLFNVKYPRFQDWEYVIRLYGKYKFVFCNQILVTQYLQSDSITKNKLKTIEAYKLLLQDYYHVYNSYPFALAKLYKNIATSISLYDFNQSKYYLKKSLKTKFLVKTFFLFFYTIFRGK